jgi:predicted metal-dependent HD superfamily phosphohydrolase
VVGVADPNGAADHPTHLQAGKGGDIVNDDDTSLWLLTDLARCTTCEQYLQPYAAAPRRRFYVCFCPAVLYDAAHLEALVVGFAAAYDRRTAATRPLITYQRWQESTRADLRQHLIRLVELALVHSPESVELCWAHSGTSILANQG